MYYSRLMGRELDPDGSFVAGWWFIHIFNEFFGLVHWLKRRQRTTGPFGAPFRLLACPGY